MSGFVQSIDLYAQLEPEQARPVTLYYMAASWGAILLLYTLASLYLGAEERAAQTEMEREKQRNQSLERELSQRKRLDDRIDLVPFDTRIQQLRAELKRQELLIEYLESSSQDSLHRFSESMAGLARQHVSGIAIEKFSMSSADKYVLIRGQLGSADALPEYVKNLRHEPTFKDLRFNKVVVTTVDDKLNFEMSSTVPVESDS